jgi:hypothetical protein
LFRVILTISEMNPGTFAPEAKKEEIIVKTYI